MAEDPKVMLGGTEYVIPELSARRIKKFAGIAFNLKSLDVTAMTEQDLDRFYAAVLIGVQQGSPDMTEEAFLDLPVKPLEVLDAMKVIAKQAGMEFEKRPPDQAAPTEQNPSTLPGSKPNGTLQSQMS